MRCQTIENTGRRGRTRTCDPRLRRPMLYPPELRARDFLIFDPAEGAAFSLFAGSGSFSAWFEQSAETLKLAANGNVPCSLRPPSW